MIIFMTHHMKINKNQKVAVNGSIKAYFLIMLISSVFYSLLGYFSLDFYLLKTIVNWVTLMI